MRRVPSLIGTLVIAATAISCGGDSAGPGGGGGGGGGGGTCPTNSFCATVSNSWSPSTRTVAAGTTITFSNNGNTTHNVTWDNATGRNAALQGDGAGDVPDFPAGVSHTRLFNATGTFGFHCTLHPGMNGSVTVQ